VQVKNKLNAKLFQLDVHNYQGAEVVELDMSSGKPIILCGKNGEGKSSTIKFLHEALGGVSMRPEKVDNPVGPFSTGKVKKASGIIGVDGDKGILELNGHSLEKFYIHYSITEKGSVHLSITDAKDPNAKPISAPREKIKNLLGLFLDPLEMVKKLDEHRGDSKIAEDCCIMAGYDPKPFHVIEETLFKEKQEEKVTLKNSQGELAKLDEPQDDWAKLYVNPVLISDEILKLNEFNTSETKKKLAIETSEKEYFALLDTDDVITRDITILGDNSALAKKDFDEKSEKLLGDKVNFDSFKTSNKPEGWEDSKSVLKLEEQIRLLQGKVHTFRKYDEDVSEKSTSIEIDTKHVVQLKKYLDEKIEAHGTKQKEKVEHQKSVILKKEEVEKVTEENKPLDWTGEKDPEEIKTPLQYLTGKMSTVEIENEQVKNREKYLNDEEGIELTKKSIKTIDEKRKQNQKNKAAAIAQVKNNFPHPGITIDYKKPFDPNDDSSKQDITVWVDFGDGLGKRTINDISEGQKLFLCTHILIAGNTGAVNVLVIKSGHALDEDNQKVIFDVAMEHGYSVILETIISTFKGAFNIKQGNVDSINTEGREIDSVDEPKDDKEPELVW
jgi:hypothetical protein